MFDLQFRDLASAAGFAAVAYGLFNMLITFGSGRPLAEWINPHRRHLLSLAGVVASGGYGLLYRGTLKYQRGYLDLLGSLVREERARAEVVGAVSFFLFAGTLLALYFWCRWLYPRDPATFDPEAADLRAEYRRAMRHYLRWAGHLDYATLTAVEGANATVLARYALPPRVVFARLRRVDVLHVPPDADPVKTADDQHARWDAQAARLFARWDELDALVAPTGHGGNGLLLFDLQFGGLFVELLHEFGAADGTRTRVFLFVACLNQHGLNSGVAVQTYNMLSRAVRHIRTGGYKPRA